MTLERQVISLPFRGGIDTKTDPLQVPLGKLLVLENATFQSPGRLKKRYGYTQLGTAISGAQALATYGNELVACAPTTLYSYSPGQNTWVSRSTMPSLTVTQTPVIRNAYQQTFQDSAYVVSGGVVQYACYVWEDSKGGSYFQLVDGTTQTLIVAPMQIEANSIKPKAVAVNGYFLLFWYNTSTKKYRGATLSASGTLGTLTDISAADTINTRAAHDVLYVSGATTVYYAYSNQSAVGAVTTVSFVPAATWAATFPSVANTAVAVNPMAGAGVITLFNDASRSSGAITFPVLAWWENGSGNLLARAFSSDLQTSLNFPGIETVANVVSCTAVSTATTWYIYYSVSAGGTYNYTTRVNTVTASSYAVGTAAVFTRSTALFGKAFLYNANPFVPLVYQSPLQPTYFIADKNANVMAKLFYSVAGPIPSRSDGFGSNQLTEVAAITSSQFQFAALAKDLLTTQSGNVYTQTGVEAVTFNFADPVNSYLHREIGQNLIFSGGGLQMYDGNTPVELGFHLYPEPVTVAAVGSGGSLSAGSYQVAVCYEWIDNQGQTHRSAPSVAVTQVAVNNDSLTVTIPTLRLTAKQSTRSNVNLVVYRTKANGTIFFQDTSITSPTLNDTTVDTKTFTSTQSDSAIGGNPMLYTTSGVIANIAPNPTTAMFVHRNRLWALDSTNPLQWWFSKQVLPPSVGVNQAPAEMNNYFIYNMDPRGGGCTAGESLDDKAIIFKATSIYYVTGQGPDATGAQNDFSDALPITTDTGCTNPRSIVRVPNGLMFAGRKGIYLLDRSLSVSYIGADVESYNAQTITSANLIPSTNQVRFTLQSGNTLVYDYFVEQWSVFTVSSLLDGTIFQNLFTYIDGQGRIAQESTAFSDLGSYISMRVQTPWIAMAQFQGFQRCRRVEILGDYASAHKLIVTARFDYSQAAGSPMFVPLDSLQQRVGWTVGAQVPYQFQLHLWQQKCEAVQIEIQDLSTGTIGESMSLSGLALEIGAKKGMRKIPAAQSYG